LRYDLRVTVTSTSAASSAGPSTPTFVEGLAHAQAANGAARIDIAKGAFGIGVLRDGDFLTLRDDGRTLLVFSPETKRYARLDRAKLAQGLNGVSSSFGGALGVQTTDVAIDVAAVVGPREMLQRYSTVRFVLTEDYTVTISVMGMKSAMATHSTTEYWFAPELTGLVNPFTSRVLPGDQFPSFLGADYATQMVAAQAKLPSGVPIKTATTSVTTDARGNRATTTTIWQLNDITNAAIPESVFDVPEGYTLESGIGDW
jgi:hypothetical protein